MFKKKPRKPEIAGQYSFSINGTSLPYVLRRSSHAHYLRLEIVPGAGLVVTAPRHAGTSFIESFIEQKQNWIRKKLEVYKAAATASPGQIKDGGTTGYLGKDMTIHLEHKEGKPAMVRLEKDRMVVNLDGGGHDLNTIIEAWYKFQANVMIKDRLEYWSNLMQIDFGAFKTRGQRTRWGSCSRNGNLSFNWKLIKTPPEVIDYVIVHELAHRKQMNHSSRFWALVERYCQDYKKHRKWLHDHNFLLAQATDKGDMRTGGDKTP
jgi:predicted metal-dependent hydrolase